MAVLGYRWAATRLNHMSMIGTFPFLLALTVGFSHAFEADHLLAVSNIVTKRQSPGLAIRDGLFWGLGHTSTILIIGFLLVLVQVQFPEHTFSRFEALVGLMLMLLGLWRLFKLWRGRTPDHRHLPDGSHHLAYGVGLVHGLAGSGALVLLVMSQIKSHWGALAYLLIFGLGSALGMLVASGLFSLPFSRKMAKFNQLQQLLTLLSCVLCLFFGAKLIFENML